MAAKAYVRMLKFGLSASLHKDVQTGCPNTPSEARVKLWNEKEPLEKERVGERTHSVAPPLPHELCFNEVFIVLDGERVQKC